MKTRYPTEIWAKNFLKHRIMKLKKYRKEIQKRYPGRLDGKAIAKIYKMGITFDDAMGRLANMEKREKLKKAEQDETKNSD